MQENYNWYSKQQSLQQNIIVQILTILHPRIDIVIITYVQNIPKTVFNRIQAKNPYKEIIIF